MPSQPVFDLNYPKVRIAFRLASDIGVRVRFGHQGAIERLKPTELAAWTSISRAMLNLYETTARF